MCKQRHWDEICAAESPEKLQRMLQNHRDRWQHTAIASRCYRAAWWCWQKLLCVQSSDCNVQDRADPDPYEQSQNGVHTGLIACRVEGAYI